MKPRIAFLISGQIRSNSLSQSVNDTTIIDSWTNNIFTEAFKSKYDYDVYIATDTAISNDKAKAYFGDHLININITRKDEYMYDWNITKKPYDYYHKIYESIDYSGHMNHIYATYQYYKMYSAYKMMKEYIKKTGVEYTYIVRLRPDSQIMQDLMTLFNILETTDVQFITEHEQLSIMTYKLKGVLKLVKHFGSYLDSVYKKNIYTFMHKNNSGYYNEHVWMHSPEKQFIDHVYYTITGLNLDFFKSFLGIVYASYNLLYRGAGKYGHIPGNSIIVPWKPYETNETILNKIGGDSM
jgi:hypothetical protein